MTNSIYIYLDKHTDIPYLYLHKMTDKAHFLKCLKDRFYYELSTSDLDNMLLLEGLEADFKTDINEYLELKAQGLLGQFTKER